MSYELPFSRPRGWSAQKVILLGLVAIHAIWIVIHLNLVSRELINPWKLGGYGMYTTVHPSPAVYLFDSRFQGFQVPVKDEHLNRLARENHHFIFRCEPITVSSLQTFLSNNPRFHGIPLRFIVTERKYLRNPIRTERRPHAVLEIRWTGQVTFDYATKVCGKVYRGESELKS
ncbi:MAG: hypothetical protein AAGA00_08615 [Pseudomonadota bacterium]